MDVYNLQVYSLPLTENSFFAVYKNNMVNKHPSACVWKINVNNNQSPLQQILSKWLFEAVADPPLVQNELLLQLENQHRPKHPS